MTKSEYMDVLRERLQHYNRALETEILEDYEQHFAEGLAEGRSEEEIIAELGNIEDMLQEFSQEDLKQELEIVESEASQSNSYEQIYRAVVIEGLVADVEVSASPDDQIRIDYENNGSKSQKLRYIFYQYEKDGIFYAGVKERRDKDLRKEVRFDFDLGDSLESSLQGILSAFSNFRGWSSSGDIHLRVQIPAGIPAVRFCNTSGDLQIKGIQTQKLETQCTSGDLRIEDADCKELYAKTQSGDQEISRIAMPLDETTEIELSTGSGDMKVRKASAVKFRMHTASGDLSGKDLRANLLRVQTASGDMELDDVECASGILRTASGDVTAKSVRGGELTAETASGEVELRANMGALDVKTGSGDIDLEADSGADRIRMITGSGEICLDISRVEGASITARTGSGDMNIKGQQMSGCRSYNTSYGNGACTVNLTTGSGDIEVR